MVEQTSIVLAGWLVDDGRMLQTTEIKHSNTTVLPTADKHINTVCAEAHVIHFFVMGDQLRLGSQGRNIPDCASCIDAGGNDETRRDRIPIEGSQRSGMIGRLGIRQKGQRSQFGGGWVGSPSNVVSRRRGGFGRQ